MILLGLTLLLVGAGVSTITFLATSNQTERIHISAQGFARDASALELALLGAAGAFILCAGWAYLAAAARRRARLRREDEEDDRLDELDRAHAEAIAEKDRQLSQSALREQELSHQVRELQVREAELEIRARELNQRENEWHNRLGSFDTDVSLQRVDPGGWDSTPWDEAPSRPMPRRRRTGA